MPIAYLSGESHTYLGVLGRPRYSRINSAEWMLQLEYCSLLADKIKTNQYVYYTDTAVDMLCQYAERGALFDLVYSTQRYLFHRRELLTSAALGGNIHVLRVLEQQTVPCTLLFTTDVLDAACQSGNFAIIQHVSNRTEGSSDEMIGNALECNIYPDWPSKSQAITYLFNHFYGTKISLVKKPFYHLLYHGDVGLIRHIFGNYNHCEWNIDYIYSLDLLIEFIGDLLVHIPTDQLALSPDQQGDGPQYHAVIRFVANRFLGVTSLPSHTTIIGNNPSHQTLSPGQLGYLVLCELLVHTDLIQHVLSKPVVKHVANTLRAMPDSSTYITSWMWKHLHSPLVPQSELLSGNYTFDQVHKAQYVWCPQSMGDKHTFDWTSYVGIDLSDPKYIGIFESVYSVNETTIKCNPAKAMSVACAAGNLAIVRFLHNYWPGHMEGFTFDPAFLYNHQDVVSFLIAYRCEGFGQDAFQAAGSIGNISIYEMLKQPLQTPCNIRGQSRSWLNYNVALEAALKSSQFDLFKHILESPSQHVRIQAREMNYVDPRVIEYFLSSRILEKNDGFIGLYQHLFISALICKQIPVAQLIYDHFQALPDHVIKSDKYSRAKQLFVTVPNLQRIIYNQYLPSVEFLASCSMLTPLLLNDRRIHEIPLIYQITQAELMIKHGFLSMLRDKLLHGHPVVFSHKSIVMACRLVKDASLFSLIYTSQQHLFTSSQLLEDCFLANNTAAVKILAAQTTPKIHFPTYLQQRRKFDVEDMLIPAASMMYHICQLPRFANSANWYYEPIQSDYKPILTYLPLLLQPVSGTKYTDDVRQFSAATIKRFRMNQGGQLEWLTSTHLEDLIRIHFGNENYFNKQSITTFDSNKKRYNGEYNLSFACFEMTHIHDPQNRDGTVFNHSLRNTVLCNIARCSAQMLRYLLSWGDADRLKDQSTKHWLLWGGSCIYFLKNDSPTHPHCQDPSLLELHLLVLVSKAGCPDDELLRIACTNGWLDIVQTFPNYDMVILPIAYLNNHQALVEYSLATASITYQHCYEDKELKKFARLVGERQDRGIVTKMCQLVHRQALVNDVVKSAMERGHTEFIKWIVDQELIVPYIRLQIKTLIDSKTSDARVVEFWMSRIQPTKDDWTTLTIHYIERNNLTLLARFGKRFDLKSMTFYRPIQLYTLKYLLEVLSSDLTVGEHAHLWDQMARRRELYVEEYEYLKSFTTKFLASQDCPFSFEIPNRPTRVRAHRLSTHHDISDCGCHSYPDRSTHRYYSKTSYDITKSLSTTSTADDDEILSDKDDNPTTTTDQSDNNSSDEDDKDDDYWVPRYQSDNAGGSNGTPTAEDYIGVLDAVINASGFKEMVRADLLRMKFKSSNSLNSNSLHAHILMHDRHYR
eukprot:gene12982-15265_t